MAYPCDIFSKLGELAVSDPSHSFCCGGQLLAKLPVRLHYKLNGGVTEVVLPGADSAVLKELLAACRRATSKVGNCDSGLYESYLGADVLTTSFQLSTTAILDEIESLIVPDRYIQAELCKLNVYTGDTKSHYESRADNSCSRDVLGTLIVQEGLCSFITMGRWLSLTGQLHQNATTLGLIAFTGLPFSMMLNMI